MGLGVWLGLPCKIVASQADDCPECLAAPTNIGALMIRIGFWGVPYYNYSIIYPKPYSNY